MEICLEKQYKRPVVIQSFLFFQNETQQNFYTDFDYALD